MNGFEVTEAWGMVYQFLETTLVIASGGRRLFEMRKHAECSAESAYGDRSVAKRYRC